jgi:hypothetical protein
MKQIRQNVFETNSSSTHSICIANDTKLIIPKTLEFRFGEFGWESDTLNSIEDKASYLYTGLMDNNRKEDIDKIIKILEDLEINIIVEKPIYETNQYTNSDGKITSYTYGKNIGFVDHSNNLYLFLNAVCENEDTLMNYLFSPLSFIITGNDNDDTDVSINVDYPHIEFYKGN